MTTGRINQVARDEWTTNNAQCARSPSTTRPAFDTRPRMCRGVTHTHTRGRAKLAGGAVKAGTRVYESTRDPTERLTPGVCAPRASCEQLTGTHTDRTPSRQTYPKREGPREATHQATTRMRDHQCSASEAHRSDAHSCKRVARRGGATERPAVRPPNRCRRTTLIKSVEATTNRRDAG